MIGRYVLATAAVKLLVVGLLLGAVVYLGAALRRGRGQPRQHRYAGRGPDPYRRRPAAGPARTPADWLQGYAWAMALDDDGSVIWQHDLPQNLNKHYTASEIASFSRWYLDDWPVFCWTADYGLFVAAVPRGSVWKYNIYNNEQLMNAMAAGMLPRWRYCWVWQLHAVCCSAGAVRGACRRLPQGWKPWPMAVRFGCRQTALRGSWPTRSTARVSSCAAAMRSSPGGTMPAQAGSPGSAMMCAHRWR